MSCGCPAAGPIAGIIIQSSAMQAAGSSCSIHCGGAHSQCSGGGAADFSMYALAKGAGIVGQDARVVGTVLAELSKGSHGNGAAAPLPSRKDRYAK